MCEMNRWRRLLAWRELLRAPWSQCPCGPAQRVGPALAWLNDHWFLLACKKMAPGLIFGWITKSISQLSCCTTCTRAERMDHSVD